MNGRGRPVVRLRIGPAGFALRRPLEREAAVLANDTIYLAVGLDSAGQSASGVFTLNPASGALASVGTMAHPFHDAAGAALGGRLFVFGGGVGEGSDIVQAFDLGSHRTSVVGHLPKALSDLSSGVVGSTVYLVGGYDGVSPQSAIYATTDGVRFRIAGRLPQGLRYAAVTSLGRALVVAGGMSASGPVSSIYLFDSAAGRVSVLGRMPTAVGHAMAFVLGETIFVAGGKDKQDRAVRQLLAIDVTARTVTRLAPLPSPLSDAASVSDGRAAWLIGGWRGHAISQVLKASVAPS